MLEIIVLDERKSQPKLTYDYLNIVCLILQKPES